MFDFRLNLNFPNCRTYNIACSKQYFMEAAVDLLQISDFQETADGVQNLASFQ